MQYNHASSLQMTYIYTYIINCRDCFEQNVDYIIVRIYNIYVYICLCVCKTVYVHTLLRQINRKAQPSALINSELPACKFYSFSTNLSLFNFTMYSAQLPKQLQSYCSYFQYKIFQPWSKCLLFTGSQCSWGQVKGSKLSKANRFICSS